MSASAHPTQSSMMHLRDILEAEDGFLARLRTELEWDKAAFKTLVDAMQRHLEQTVAEDKIERWVADGFWFTETFTQDWIRHPDFPKQHSVRYYEQALRRLHELSHWLFLGECPEQSGTLPPFDPDA